MARQKGIIKIQGQIDDLSFYESKDGFIVRKKGGVSGARIAKDPAFLRTRENGQEFKNSASSGKILRDAIRALLYNSTDTKVVSRLTQLMSVIKNMDSTSVRGERNVAVALANAPAKLMLKGFDFNIDAPLSQKLFRPATVDASTGVISILDLVPVTGSSYPDGATHVAIKGAQARIDFVSGKSEVFETNTVNVPIDMTPNNVSLVPSGVPSGNGTDIFLLKIEFYQEINGVQYNLQTETHSVLNIIEVL